MGIKVIKSDMRVTIAVAALVLIAQARATLILVMNTSDGLVMCADNRVRTENVDRDGHHKIMVSKNGIVMTMTGSSTIEAKRPQDADYRQIYSFYTETIDYLNHYDSPDQVDWQGLGAFLQNGFLNKVIRVIGVPPNLRAFDNPNSKIKSIDELQFYYVEKKHYLYASESVDYREVNDEGQVGIASFSPRGLLDQATSAIMTFGRWEIFQLMSKEGERAFELADKQQQLRDMRAHIKQTKTAGLDYLTDADHAIEASRYIIYITSTLGPNMVVSPTCDCGVLKPSGTFDLKSSLEPMTPDKLKFTTNPIAVGDSKK